MSGKSRRKRGTRSGTGHVPATEFKTNCLALLDRVGRTREEITVTKHGKPVAKLVPLSEKAQPLFGCMAGTVTRYGDLVSPIEEHWRADG